MNTKLVVKAVLTGLVAVAGIVVQALPDGTKESNKKAEKTDDNE